MANYIIKLKPNAYIQWSTAVDAPASCVLSEDEAKTLVSNIAFEVERVRDEGDPEIKILRTEIAELTAKKRWERISTTGTSALTGFSAKDLEGSNTAGPNGERLSIEELIEIYALTEEKKGRFPFV